MNRIQASQSKIASVQASNDDDIDEKEQKSSETIAVTASTEEKKAYLSDGGVGFVSVVSSCADTDRAVVRTAWDAVMHTKQSRLVYDMSILVYTFMRLPLKSSDKSPSSSKQSSSSSSSPTPATTTTACVDRLPPIVVPVNINDTVQKVVDALVAKYDAYGVEADEIRLVANGHELTDFTRPIHQCSGLGSPPYRWLFVLQKVFSDFGGWNVIADDLAASDDGLIIRNTGSEDKWRPARCNQSIGEDGGEYMFELKILRCPATANSWKICVGVVGTAFRENSDRAWIGSQPCTWAYIAGTGGICHNSGQSTAYGEEFGEGDIIRVRLDFDKGEIEFFRNDVSQGVAFDNLGCAVYPAVSLTATGSSVQLVMKSTGQ